jgi:hypothetical protein
MGTVRTTGSRTRRSGKMTSRPKAVFGLINFSPELLCDEDALGQPIEITVGKNTGTLTFTSRSSARFLRELGNGEIT